MGHLIRMYITIGATMGTILAVPPWQAALVAHPWPRELAQVWPLALPLLLATGHGVLRMYSWLPSAIYFLGYQHTAFQHWLFDGW